MKHKWTLFQFNAGDYKGVEAYLNRQAAKGWELEKAGGFFARWRRTDDPSKWCVDLIGARKEREEKAEYLDLCREGGWEPISVNGSICIFRSRAEKEAFPIQTDPELEKKNYKQYYLKPAILSVIYIVVMIAMYSYLGLTVGTRFDNVAVDLQYGWMEYWMVSALYLGIPVWGLMALWKVFHFISSQVRNRGNEVKAPPPWAMWVNSVLSLASLLMGILLLLGIGLDKVLGGLSGGASLYGVLPVIIITCLYQWLKIDKELYKGEKRRALSLALAFFVALVVLIAADVSLPYGEWSTSWYSSDKDTAAVRYEESFAYPIVHGEDVGISFDDAGESVGVEHKATPMGESWALRYFYDDEKTTHGWVGLGSYTVTAPFRWQADFAADALAHGMGLERYAPWPEEGLTPVEIDWADEAWHGELRYEDGELITILVLRVGTRAARLSFPTDLMTAECLAAIRAELTK